MSQTTTKQESPWLREADARPNKKGDLVVDWNLTTTSQDDTVRIVVPPRYTVPIIFVPGIMGSNLKAISKNDIVKKNEPVWLLDSKGGIGWRWLNTPPATRQLLLDPNNTTVYGGGEVPDIVETIGDKKIISKERYWGEVGSASYMAFLTWLEENMNGYISSSSQQQLQGKNFAKQWHALKSFEDLSKRELGHAMGIRFPVYACGYNWLQSNLTSAETLLSRIDFIIADNNKKKFPCEKVILVTHSMGGLVARACSELLGMQSKIAGIVHGVMPANGAAAAYKRVKAGTEGTAGVVLGPDADTVSAVFANSPGALQLLPNQFYPQGWLKIGTGQGNNFKEVMALPKDTKEKKGDPYDDIYLQRGKWWGLMEESRINPAKIKKHSGWKVYADNVEDARLFHSKLNTQYHPNTYAFYGNDKEGDCRTWGTVRWECQAATDMSRVTDRVTSAPGTHGQIDGNHQWVPVRSMTEQTIRHNASIVLDNGTGKMECRAGTIKYYFNISTQDSAGDGTVPAISGNAPFNVTAKQVYALLGIGHESAYNDTFARQATLHAILKIASEVVVC